LDTSSPQTVTRLLLAWSQGDAAASEELLALVYDDLKLRARRQLRRERKDHTLQPTALVHEAYLRLVRQSDMTWVNRAQFLGMAAIMMRRVLLDHGRGRGAAKRGGSWVRVSLDPDAGSPSGPDAGMGDLEGALDDLAVQDARQARLVELRVFGGLSYEEAAHVMKISPAIARREWTMARAWLFRRLRPPARPPA
jgi:RNA polymerase sigma factor (TIGR02999 family)